MPNLSNEVYIKMLGTKRHVPTVRQRFEYLIIQLTDCRTGDGTLEVKSESPQDYKNEHVQYMWTRFQIKHREAVKIRDESKAS